MSPGTGAGPASLGGTGAHAGAAAAPLGEGDANTGCGGGEVGPPVGARVLLGVDPGTAVTGFGVVRVDRRRRAALLQCGVVRTSAGAALSVRLRQIHEAMAELLAEFRPVAMSIENVFQGKNARSALTLGHARGVIILAAALEDVKVFEYAPREIKRAVAGTGSATKDQVAYMVQRHLRLRSAPRPADAADGVAAALCHGLKGALP